MPRKPAPAPPPTVAELVFQTYQFDDRIQRRTSGTETPLYNSSLGAAFFGTHGRDMTIQSQMANRLRGAGNLLL